MSAPESGPRRPSVLLVLGSSTGGIGRHVHTLARRLVQRGHAVVVAGPADTDRVFDWGTTGASFRAVPLRSPRPDTVRAAVRELRAAAAGSDVVHAHGVRAAATAALAGLRPLVATWHNGPHDRWRRRLAHPLLERLAARRAAVTLTVSDDLAARARRAGAASVRTVAVVAPPLPPPGRPAGAVRAELGVGDRPLVVAMARLEPQKRLDVLVRAVAEWPDDAVPVVVIAGTGSLEPALRRLAADTGAPVTLLGRRDDVSELLAAADAVALPSAWEGYPLVAQEALRAGRPLVATAVGGIPALVGDAAVLVPAGDPEALRRALVTVLTDGDVRHRLAAAGPARAATWPSEDDMMDELVSIYLDVSSR